VRLFVGAIKTTDDNTIHPRKDVIFLSGKEDKKKCPLRIYNTAFPRQQWLSESV
jgi:hypothetical protein